MLTQDEEPRTNYGGSALHTDLARRKEAFLGRVGVYSRYDAVSNALQAAMQRNRTYVTDSLRDRQRFGNTFKREISARDDAYRHGVMDGEHVAIIQKIAGKLSEEYCDILDGHHLRIGTVQKALNLYLKFMWCLEKDWATPPHCPVDSTVLQAAGIAGAWTQLDSIEVYEDWISRLRRYAKRLGYGSLAEWELSIWSNL